mmetsp:Transcript_20054/g.31423  ORF Transcript_20054/g.31423 Transcript_20054/m.31423 type:complete len:241 (-) Transcript_20054:20-742(-)
MCSSFHFFVSADGALGKIDKASFSQQTLMELLTDGIVDKSVFSRDSEIPEDISQWNGVTVSDANEVTEIEWRCAGLEGTINLQWLPLTVKEATIANGLFDDNVLSGTLDLTALPDGLTQLLLSDNEYSGEIDLTTLPSQLRELDVSNNKIWGTINVTNLPSGMKKLHLNDNRFEGSTDFGNLPESLWMFDVANTNLEGTIYLHAGHSWFDVEDSGVKIVIVEASQEDTTVTEDIFLDYLE